MLVFQFLLFVGITNLVSDVSSFPQELEDTIFDGTKIHNYGPIIDHVLDSVQAYKNKPLGVNILSNDIISIEHWIEYAPESVEDEIKKKVVLYGFQEALGLGSEKKFLHWIVRNLNDPFNHLIPAEALYLSWCDKR